jgi:vanillate O-demethylase ferredoxin subunit
MSGQDINGDNMDNPTSSTAAALLRARVSHREQQAEGVVALTLEPADGQTTLPAFDAGAHIDLHLPNGMVRQYSLCNAPYERHRYVIAVLREDAGRGGSACVHDSLHVGTELSIGHPRNAFALTPCAHTVLLAGGIGLTPLLAMAEQLWAAQASFELHVCARSAARLPFRQRMLQSAWAPHTHLHHDDGAPEQKLDVASLLRQLPPGAEVWVCGPAGFIAHVRQSAQQLGWPDARVHAEHFAPVPLAQADAAPEGAFTVEWQPTGQRIQVPPEKSVAQVLEAAGIALTLSCEQGICGSCSLRVVEGEADHRDMYFSDDERTHGGHFTPCCSRSHGPLLVLTHQQA